MNTNIKSRLEKLEAANGNGKPIYVLKWSDETDEQALEREAMNGRELDLERVVFFVWGRSEGDTAVSRGFQRPVISIR